MTIRPLPRMALCLACGLGSLLGPSIGQSYGIEFLRRYFKWHCHDLGGCHGYYPTCWQAWPCGPQHCPPTPVPIYGPVAPFQLYTPEGPLEDSPAANPEEVLPPGEVPPPPPPVPLESPPTPSLSQPPAATSIHHQTRAENVADLATETRSLVGHQRTLFYQPSDRSGELPEQTTFRDQALADNIRREILGREDLGKFEAQIRVRAGIVRLYGRTQTAATREALVEIARGVPGVVEVQDWMFPREPQSAGSIEAVSFQPGKSAGVGHSPTGTKAFPNAFPANDGHGHLANSPVQIREGQTPATSNDQVLADRIRKALAARTDLRIRAAQVRVEAGRVWIYTSLDSAETVREIRNLVRNMPGVAEAHVLPHLDDANLLNQASAGHAFYDDPLGDPSPLSSRLESKPQAIPEQGQRTEFPVYQPSDRRPVGYQAFSPSN